ncbi:TPA: hypothetical protein MND73_000782 [Salmonella enterica subsp. houtenae]|nr:hypothetical protein [Salmonella enterica subsp. houtenae]
MMDFEITGEETQEQLEAMFGKIGDVEFEENGEEEIREEKTDGHPDKQTQNNTGDNVASTPDASAAGNEPQVTGGVLTRDGKHVIPYDIPCSSAVQVDRAESVIIFMIKKKLLKHH